MMPLSVQNIDPGARIFTWDDSSFSKLWHRVLTKAGIRYRKPHACRHSFASILLSRGANLLAVQRAGGWKSATVMLSTYAKWIEDASNDASIGEVGKEVKDSRGYFDGPELDRRVLHHEDGLGRQGHALHTASSG
jgi:hypothetical protein